MNSDRTPYDPKPLDTSRTELPRALEPLLEALAENAHDVWAALRRDEGWTHGSKRHDSLKQHPGLVSYGELPESEKNYDRRMATETLKFIVAQGYRLVPPSVGTPADDSEELSVALTELGSSPEPTLARALAVWRDRSPNLWAQHPELYELLSARLLGLGEPVLAHDVLSRARADLEPSGRWRESYRLRHLLGLALARSGATLQANQIALQLRADSPTESGVLEDTLGLLGRTLKDIALSEHDRTRRRARFREAHDAYLEALNRAPSSYSAINAASTALFAGHDAAAVQLARSARELAITELEREEAFGHSTFWQRATLGEAALLLGEREEAKRQFAVATAYARTHRKYGDLASTRRQARLILEERGEAPEWLDSALRAPTVVIFSGHSIDMPDRATPLYPPELEERVRRAIDERLEQLDAGFGFSSAANGGEIQFQEAMRSRGGETYVVLPYGEAEFCETNVRGLPSGDWISRYNAVLATASECVAATGQPSMQRGVLFQYANSLMLGMAMLRARTLDTRLVALTLWDRHSSSAAGSTASVVRAWRRAGHNVEIIDIGAIAGSRAAAP